MLMNIVKIHQSVRIDFYSMDLKKGKGRPLSSLAVVEQTKLYKMRRPVSEQKKRDMIDLLQFIYSPNRQHFFKNLPVTVNTRSRQQFQAVIITEDENDDDEPIYDI